MFKQGGMGVEVRNGDEEWIYQLALQALCLCRGGVSW